MSNKQINKNTIVYSCDLLLLCSHKKVTLSMITEGQRKAHDNTLCEESGYKFYNHTCFYLQRYTSWSLSHFRAKRNSLSTTSTCSM